MLIWDFTGSTHSEKYLVHRNKNYCVRPYNATPWVPNSQAGGAISMSE